LLNNEEAFFGFYPVVERNIIIKSDLVVSYDLIGNSMVDIDGSHTAGVSVIGYANRPEKVEHFTSADPTVVIMSVVDVASVLGELRL
jgi:hypothetical protein